MGRERAPLRQANSMHYDPLTCDNDIILERADIPAYYYWRQFGGNACIMIKCSKTDYETYSPSFPECCYANVSIDMYLLRDDTTKRHSCIYESIMQPWGTYDPDGYYYAYCKRGPRAMRRTAPETNFT